MISGTEVNEKIMSFSDGKIFRLVATGWKPRKVSLEIIEDGKVIKIKEMGNLLAFNDELTKFIKEEIKNNEKSKFSLQY